MSKPDDYTVVTCSRKMPDHPDGRCGAEIELISDNLVVMRASVPLLSAICPECGYSNPLKKILSIQLVEDVYGGELPDDDDEFGDDDPMIPVSEGLAQKAEAAIKLFGYSDKKWKQPIKVIKEFVRDNSQYQNPQGVAQLLATMKINSQYIPLIVQKMFGGSDMQQNIGQYNIDSQMPSQSPMFQYGNQPHGYPQSNMMVPGGSQSPIIVMPSQPVPSVATRDDSTTVEETVNKDGDVVKRVTRRNGNVVEPPKSDMDAMLGMIAMMKELGVIGDNKPAPVQAPATSPEIANALAAMAAAISKIGDSNKDSVDSRAFQREESQRVEVKTMAEKLDEMRAAQHKATMDSMQAQMNTLTDIAKNGNSTGMNDNQFKVNAQSDNLRTITGAIESMGKEVVGPLVSMQTMQAQMNAAMMMRNMEAQDGVAAGSYSSLVGAAEVPEETVAEDLERWKAKAAHVKLAGVESGQ